MQTAASGFYVPGDGKALVGMVTGKQRLVFLASQNSGPLKAFELASNKQTIIRLLPGEESVEYSFKNGGKRKEEVYMGNSFYSQSGRYIQVGPSVKSITVTGMNDSKRVINF